MGAAGLALGVRDPETGAGRRLQTQIADADVAQLADAHARTAKGRNDGAAADVGRRSVRSQAAQVPTHGRLRETELGRDIEGSHPPIPAHMCASLGDATVDGGAGAASAAGS